MAHSLRTASAWSSAWAELAAAREWLHPRSYTVEWRPVLPQACFRRLHARERVNIFHADPPGQGGGGLGDLQPGGHLKISNRRDRPISRSANYSPPPPPSAVSRLSKAFFQPLTSKFSLLIPSMIFLIGIPLLESHLSPLESEPNSSRIGAKPPPMPSGVSQAMRNHMEAGLRRREQMS